MKSVNKVILVGNVTRDVELKQTKSGQMVCQFGLATNRVWKNKDGEKQSLVEFHNLVAWGTLAEFCEQYIKKGKPLYVEGYLKTRSWEDEKAGKKMYRTEVIIEDVVLLGARPESEPDVVRESADAADHDEDIPA